MQNIESIKKYVFIQVFPIGKDSSRYLLQATSCLLYANNDQNSRTTSND